MYPGTVSHDRAILPEVFFVRNGKSNKDNTVIKGEKEALLGVWGGAGRQIQTPMEDFLTAGSHVPGGVSCL